MNRIGHIFRKDATAIAVPLAAWLALVALHTIVFACYRGITTADVATLSASGIFERLSERTELEEKFLPLIVGVELCVSGMLVFRIVNEDPVNGSRAFWRTRPINSARLFAAKVVALLGLLVVAPVLVLMAIWGALGFSLHDITLAAKLEAIEFVETVVIAFGTAALCSGTASFVVLAVSWCAILPICTLLFRQTINFAAIIAVSLNVWLVSAAIAGIVQYARPARRWGALVLVVGVGTLVTINGTQPSWALAIAQAMRGNSSERSSDESAHAAALHLISSRIDDGVLSLQTNVPWDDDYFAAIIGGSTVETAAKAANDWTIGPSWGAPAAVEFLRSNTIRTGDWLLTNLYTRGPFDPNMAHHAEWTIAWLRPRVAWRSPASQGVAVRQAAESVLVQCAAWQDSGVAFFVSERWPAAQTKERTDTRRIDTYILLAPDVAHAYGAEVHEVRALQSNGIAVVSRELRFKLPETGKAWMNRTDLTLVKVEFDRGQTFERVLADVPPDVAPSRP